MAKQDIGCARPTGSVVGQEAPAESITQPARKKEMPVNRIMVGRKAPDFVAPAYHKGAFTQIKLSDLLGKWVVLCFYPGDFTFVCTTEIAATSAKYSEFQALGVEFMSVSVDSQFVHKIWDENELSKMVDGGVPFPMISDAAGHLGAAYGVYDDEAGVDVRGRFIIDPDGIVQAMEVVTPPVGRRVEETIRQIQAFQHVRASGGTELTPSGWTPGKKTLKPGPDLVGRIWEVWKPGDE